MTPRAIRLHQINQKLEVCFRYPDEDEDESNHLGRLAVGGVAVGAGGYGAMKAHKAIVSRQGGMNAMRSAGAARTSYVDAAKNLGSSTIADAKGAIAGSAAAVKNTGANALESLLAKLKSFRR